MRYDYLYRYYDKFGTGSRSGFRRMMDGGFNARNNHYHYAATYTGPGHAAIYTGSAPALNGIVGNDFYERNLGRLMYCAEDTTVSTVGNTGTAGKMSPRNLLRNHHRRSAQTGHRRTRQSNWYCPERPGRYPARWSCGQCRLLVRLKRRQFYQQHVLPERTAKMGTGV